MNIKEDPLCRLCGEEYDTGLHLLGRYRLIKQHQKVTKKTIWKKTFPSSKQIKTGALELTLEVC